MTEGKIEVSRSGGPDKPRFCIYGEDEAYGIDESISLTEQEIDVVIRLLTEVRDAPYTKVSR